MCGTLKKNYKTLDKNRNKLNKSQDELLEHYIDKNTMNDGTPITDPGFGDGEPVVGSIFRTPQ